MLRFAWRAALRGSLASAAPALLMGAGQPRLISHPIRASAGWPFPASSLRPRPRAPVLCETIRRTPASAMTIIAPPASSPHSRWPISPIRFAALGAGSLAPTHGAYSGGQARLQPQCELLGRRAFRLSCSIRCSRFISCRARRSGDDWQADHQIRHVFLNMPHSARTKPSDYGELIGHYEGDTLVVDTIGLNSRTYIDGYQTPHTEQLHVIERFHMIDGWNNFLKAHSSHRGPGRLHHGLGCYPALSPGRAEQGRTG